MPAIQTLRVRHDMQAITGGRWPDARTRALLAAWVALLLVAVLAYLPGLSGPFLFDDFGSLAELGQRGGVRDWETFKAFVFGGHAGPTGRPLSLLTFLLDGSNWPTDPWPFKRTNLVIHLLNGLLLGFVVARILKALDYRADDARWIALATAGFWLLHPFLVSTTLYAVQRMAQLSTLFVFAGLAGHLVGRDILTRNARLGYLVMTLSLGGFTILAMLSKENGILLPLLVGVLEFTIFAALRERAARLHTAWLVVCIGIPTLVVLAYLGERVLRDTFFEALPPRDFSAYERWLTQWRVLADYLRHWFVPELYTAGVFQDHFVRSTGFFKPITTAVGLVFHVSLIGAAIAVRRSVPLLALAVLFFYGAHLVESTVINLELYFEHRNYLAAAFLVLPLVAILRMRANARLFAVVSLGVMALLAGFTRYSATVWSDYGSLVEASAHKAPLSARAQSQYATVLFNAGRFDEAVNVLDDAIDRMPDDLSLRIGRGVLLCKTGRLAADDFEEMVRTVSAAPYDGRYIRLYTELVDGVALGRCPAITTDDLRRLFTGMLRIPVNADPAGLRYSQIQYFIGVTDVYGGRPDDAAAAFRESLAARPGASHAMMMAAVFASTGHPTLALDFSALALDALDSGDQGLLATDRVNREDVLAFRETVQRELDELSDDSTRQD